jgi:hypothetical protein
VEDDLTIPAFLRLTNEERKAAWERNPPKPAPIRGYVQPRTAADQAIIDESKQQTKALKTLKRKARTMRKEREELVKREAKQHVGQRWDAMHARWIDPIEHAMLPRGERAMAKKKTTTTNNMDEFGLRTDTNYARMMACLVAHKGELVKLDALAKAAYGNGANLEKHKRRVIAMVRRVQTKIVTPKRLPYVLKKEKMDDSAIGIGLFNKQSG